MPPEVAWTGAQRSPEEARAQARRVVEPALVARNPRRGRVESRTQAKRVEMIVQISPIEWRREQVPNALQRPRS
jgi:hypothetical protein